MLGQRLRRWTNIEATLCQHSVFAEGMIHLRRRCVPRQQIDDDTDCLSQRLTESESYQME